MINATPVRPLTSSSPSGLPTPAASTSVPPANTPPTPPPATGGMKPVPKKKFSPKLIMGLIVFMIVAIGSVAGFYLTQMNQDTRQQASTAGCPAGSTPINAGTCQCANGGPIIPTTGTCPTAPPVNNCVGDGLACQGVAGNLRCLEGYAPENSKSCGNPGNSVCCKRIPDQAGPNCPVGSNPEGNFCRCNGGGLIPPTGSCIPDNCPDRSTPVMTGSNVGKCKCSETSSNGSLVSPGGTCPPAVLIQTCASAGGTCRAGGCGDGFVGIPNTSQCSAGSNCCKAATKCSDYNGANKCNSSTDSLNCAWDTAGNVCKDSAQTAQTCVQTGGTCALGVCPTGTSKLAGGGVCNNSSYVCCTKPTGTGGNPNTCIGTNLTCQSSGSGTNLGCFPGYVPENTKTCGEAGKVCCKPAPAPTTCPVGSTRIIGGVDAGACKCTNSGAVVEIGGSCVATNCIGSTPVTSGANIGKCTCPGGTGTLVNPGQSCPTTGGGGGGGSQCSIAAGQRCTPGATACCANGGVCQGVAGQEVCQIPTTSPNAQCGTGGTCTGWYGFKCTQLITNAEGKPECLSNGQPFSSRTDAIAYAGSCGQVDQVCVGGPKAGQLCGDFTVFNQSCGGGGGTNPSPSPSPIGAMCLNITMTVNGAAATSTTKPKIGDRLVFTCGQVQRAARYRIRVIEPGGTRVNLNSTNRVSQPYGVKVAGTFKAECSVCTGEAGSTCTDWPTKDN